MGKKALAARLGVAATLAASGPVGMALAGPVDIVLSEVEKRHDERSRREREASDAEDRKSDDEENT